MADEAADTGVSFPETGNNEDEDVHTEIENSENKLFLDN